MLCAFRDVDDVTGMEADGWFAPFLIDAFATDTDENLVTAMMNVPVVAATWFEGNVAVTLNGLFAISEVLWLNRNKVAVSCEILCM